MRLDGVAGLLQFYSLYAGDPLEAVDYVKESQATDNPAERHLVDFLESGHLQRLRYRLKIVVRVVHCD